MFSLIVLTIELYIVVPLGATEYSPFTAIKNFQKLTSWFKGHQGIVVGYNIFESSAMNVP